MIVILHTCIIIIGRMFYILFSFLILNETQKHTNFNSAATAFMFSVVSLNKMSRQFVLVMSFILTGIYMY